MLRFVGLAVLGVASAGCVPVETTSTTSAANEAAFSQQLRSADVPTLCATYSSGASEQTRLMVEAELGARGVEQCESVNVGSQSAAQVGVARFARSGQDTGVAGQDYDCGDLGSSARAQRFFLASGGPSSDPYNLDGDGDGFACEWGAEVRRLAARPAPRAPAPAIQVAAPRSTGSGCFTGPRGGTYTITASGNRNYGGC